MVYSAVLSAAEDGLIARYTFDEGSGAIAKDVTGNGHDGKITGATYVKAPLDYSGYDQIRFRIRAVAKLDRVMPIRFILHTDGKSVINQLLPSFRPGTWAEVVSPIRDLPNMNKVTLLHFFLCESDYKHGDIMCRTNIALPHVYDPLDPKTYPEFIRLFARSTGRREGDRVQGIHPKPQPLFPIPQKAEAFRKSGDIDATPVPAQAGIMLALLCPAW